VFVPCGHMVTCDLCAGEAVRAGNGCPMCRGITREALRVFK